MSNDPDTFTHAGKEYDLTKLRHILRGEKATVLKTNLLTWVLQYDRPDEDRVRKARLRWPLLVTKWNGKWTVIDGLHRLERCRRLGVPIVPVKIVTEEQLTTCAL
jgi:hypothetical protein